MIRQIDKEEAKSYRRAQARQWLQDLLLRDECLPTDIARKAGLSPSTILRFLGDKTNTCSVSFETVRAVSDGNNWPIRPEIYAAYEIPIPTGVEGEAPVPVLPFSRTMTPRTMPLRILQTRPDNGINADSLIRQPGSRINRPQELDGDSTAYGFPMPDDALAPFYPVNTIMFATRSRELARNEIAVIQFEDGREMVRPVTAATSDEILVLEPGQFHPTAIPRARIRDYSIIRGSIRP